MKEMILKKYADCLEKDAVFEIDDINATKLFKEMYQKGVFKIDTESLKEFRGKAIQELSKPVKTSLNKFDIKAINEMIKKFRLIEKGELSDQELELKIKEKSAAIYFRCWINKQLDEKNDVKKYFE